MTKTETLDQITRAEADAQEAAQQAAAAAEAARQKAEQARERLSAERATANRAYLEKLTREQPQARTDALNAQADARAALEEAVRTGGDVFVAYQAWVAARIAVWAVELAVQQQREFFGQPARETPLPAFNFNIDVGQIIDQLALEQLDAAEQRVRERRAAFLMGKGDDHAE